MKTFGETGGKTAYVPISRLAAFLLCLALAAALLLPAAAEPEAKVVRVGWYESSFNTTDGFGRRSGYAYEYQMKVAAYTGWKYEYITGSWPELLQMLIRGEIDLMSDVSYTPGRAEEMLFPSLPMGAEDYYLFVSADNREIFPADFSTLNGKKVGVNRESIQADFFREWAAGHGVACELAELMCGEDESLRMLQTGQLDAYVTVDSFESGHFSEPEGLVPVAKVGSSDFFFAVSKQRPDLLMELDSALNRIQEENRNYSQQLVEKHLVIQGANAFLSAAEEEWLANHGPVRVGYQDNYLAFCAKDPETGKLTGALQDYLDYAADCIRNVHIDFEATAYPTAGDAFAALKRGEVDCVFPANLSISDAEEEGMLIVSPIMRTDLLAVIRQADRQIFSGREHVVVAVNEGNPNYDSCLMTDFPGWHPVYYPTTADCLKAVAQGVADCVLISSYRYSNIARQCGKDRLAPVSTGAVLDYSFAVAAGETELYSILSRTVNLVPSSAVNTALSRFVAEDSKTTVGDFLQEHAVGLAAAAGAVLLLILLLLIRSVRAGRKAAGLISATENDALTGLYNRDYFLQYAAHLSRERPDRPMDAVVINIDRFHSVNALNGRTFGDRVLRGLGGEVRLAADENEGIAGRFEADRFDIYCRHREEYRTVYERLQARLDALAPTAEIRLRMGVMPWQAGTDVVQMFDKARTACSLARNSIGNHLVVFDAKMQEQEDYEQRLLSDLHRALSSYEFEVYYQPQYDIQCDPPKPVSAEALVRWNHPELGLIPPGDFIQLFERHGKIGEVDRYVWSEAARQTARWRDLYGVEIPVSVNLSRIDVFDPELESALDRLLLHNALDRGMLRLEVTESAYTENADQVVRVVEGLRRKGYIVEMDDFGTGYSSLNMLSTMPVDVLKMDRAFIRMIGGGEENTHLVSLILELARGLKIPVVAEGVETEQQLRLLRKLGCQLVQGFYFSRPLPADEFEETVIRKAQDGAGTNGKGESACGR